MIGRPCEYTQEVADRICAKLSEGESLRTVCKADDMPCAATVFNWLRAKPDFLEQYTRAKEESADAFSEEMLDIADDGTNDWMERQNAEGENSGWQVNGEHIQRSRLRIETRKWLASKLKPKKYGDKQQLEHTGANGGPIEQRVERDEATLRALTGIFERITYMGETRGIAPGMSNGTGLAAVGSNGANGHRSSMDDGADSGGSGQA